MDARTSRRVAGLAAAVLALALVAGCTSAPSGGGSTTTGGSSGGSAPSGASLTKADKGKTVEVAKDGQVTVALEGNPTTGFDWYPADLPAILTQEGESEFKTDTPGVVGAGGTVTLKFKAVRTGEGDLKLEYKRTFEKGVAPAETWSAKIVVK